jgi:hypothetical protein
MNHISMPLCIVLIALMYFILREPCPCDEEDKVVEGLDWWWWVLIIIIVILIVLGRGVYHFYKQSKKQLDDDMHLITNARTHWILVTVILGGIIGEKAFTEIFGDTFEPSAEAWGHLGPTA